MGRVNAAKISTRQTYWFDLLCTRAALSINSLSLSSSATKSILWTNMNILASGEHLSIASIMPMNSAISFGKSPESMSVHNVRKKQQLKCSYQRHISTLPHFERLCHSRNSFQKICTVHHNPKDSKPDCPRIVHLYVPHPLFFKLTQAKTTISRTCWSQTHRISCHVVGKNNGTHGSLSRSRLSHQ